MRKHLIALALSLPFCALTAFAQKMTFRFVFPDGREVLQVAPLRWHPTRLLGYDGLSIYYPTRITAR